jgi:hypothetical protein
VAEIDCVFTRNNSSGSYPEGHRFKSYPRNQFCMLDRKAALTVRPFGFCGQRQDARQMAVQVDSQAFAAKVKEPVWIIEACGGDNSMVRIGEAAYFMSPDGYLMPIKKNQPPPDLHYSRQPQN